MKLYDQAMFFLRGLEENRITDKDDQFYVAKHIRDFCRNSLLPEIPVLFDEKGAMSFALSDEDAVFFKKMLLKRWSIVDEAFERGGDVYGSVYNPVAPAFVRDFGFSTHCALDDVEENMLNLLLDQEQLAEYEEYALQREFKSAAVNLTSEELRLVKEGWEVENDYLDFPIV